MHSPGIRAACVVVTAIVCAALANEPAPSPTRLVLLGTGTPNADPERSGPSVAVVAGGTPYIVDFGPGVVRRAAAAHRKGVEALAVKNLRLAFVTHLHSDHTTGYPDLIFSPWTLERDVPLQVYGPPGIEAMTRHIVAAYREDVHVRLEGLEPANSTGYRVRARDVRPGVIYRDPNVTVTAFAVRHGSWRHAYGYRFEAKDRTIVISGDAAPSESIVEACRGCDVLLHEVYAEAGFRTRPPEWQRYHAAFHTSSRELGALASRARPKLLVLYHQLLWGTSPADVLKEIAQVYAGAVAYGSDLDVF